ncbi:MAG: 5-oxoprolinase/urea amidolyase family protein [Sphaerobacter sp.]|nr:5-oxoprolinase/urea amidolyase family protein [Sphaerobacter sp.]
MLEVKNGGIETTVQDYPGRIGLLDQGIFPAGPMDDLAFRLANLLVGNDPGAAGLEVTAGGAEFVFTDARVIAVCGADMQPRLNGAPIERWRSYEVAPGDSLALGWLNGPGFRAYVAVSGGIDVPVVLGSRATYAPGEIGGHEGRALRAGDRLPLGTPSSAAAGGRRVKPDLVPTYGSEWVVEAVRGPQADPDYFTPEDMDFFFSHAWTLDRNSNRTGYRLDIHRWQWARTTGGVAGGHPSNILDNGYPVGAVNVAGDQPIILTVDGPTLGGFVCCAVVAQAAMWKLGQMVPGWDKIRFKEVDIAQAADLARQLERVISADSLERV